MDDPKAYTAPWTITLEQVIVLNTELIDDHCMDWASDFCVRVHVRFAVRVQADLKVRLYDRRGHLQGQLPGFVEAGLPGARSAYEPELAYRT